MISNGDGKSALILKNDRSSTITPCTVLGDVIKAIHANCGKKKAAVFVIYST